MHGGESKDHAAFAPLAFMLGTLQGGVEPPRSKALRAFSCTVVS
jgi:hypothetical protein